MFRCVKSTTWYFPILWTMRFSSVFFFHGADDIQARTRFLSFTPHHIISFVGQNGPCLTLKRIPAWSKQQRNESQQFRNHPPQSTHKQFCEWGKERKQKLLPWTVIAFISTLYFYKPSLHQSRETHQGTKNKIVFQEMEKISRSVTFYWTTGILIFSLNDRRHQ